MRGPPGVRPAAGAPGTQGSEEPEAGARRGGGGSEEPGRSGSAAPGREGGRGVLQRALQPAGAGVGAGEARRFGGGVGGGEAGNVAAGARCCRAAGGRVSPRFGIPLLCEGTGEWLAAEPSRPCASGVTPGSHKISLEWGQWEVGAAESRRVAGFVGLRWADAARGPRRRPGRPSPGTRGLRKERSATRWVRAQPGRFGHRGLCPWPLPMTVICFSGPLQLASSLQDHCGWWKGVGWGGWGRGKQAG